MSQRSLEIRIPRAQKAEEHHVSGAKWFALAFFFPNGTEGRLVLTKGSKFPWKPGEELEKVTLHFHDEKGI